MKHNTEDLSDIFAQTFYQQYQTRLVKGDGEPVYLPGDDKNPDHRILFAHGFYASALHEISHWLVAGKKRRLLEDFGYWYHPDGRSDEQQAAFEQMEVKPQAIEWSLCVAVGCEFNVSCDNLDGTPPDRFAFQLRVQQQVARFLADGYPQRVRSLLLALADFYHTRVPTDIGQFGFEPPLEASR